MSDGGSDADRRRWTHKRAQFDNAIHSARLYGFIQKLAGGETRYQDTLRILLEVNASADQSQYVAETLAMKKEVRGIARLEFHPEVAVFFSEVSRLIPQLTDGLASQVMMLLGHAAQNDAYLDTVSNAVSELLADLDHPLNREARNYLRLLWDQMEATRRLKQTEALFPGSSMPPPSGPPRESRDSAQLPRLARTESESKTPVGLPAVPQATHRLPEIPALPPEHRVSKSESGSKTLMGMSAPVHLQADASDRISASGTPAPSENQTLRGTGGAPVSPAVEPINEAQLSNRQPPGPNASHDKAFDDQTNEFFSQSEAPRAEADATSSWRSAQTSRPPAPPERDPNVKLPTNSVPRWAVITASIIVAAVVGAVVYVTREPEAEEPAAALPSVTASASATSARGTAAPPAAAKANSGASVQPAAPPPPPPPAPAATPDEAPAMQPTQPAHTRHTVSPPAGKLGSTGSSPAPTRVAIDSPSAHTQSPPKTSAAAASASSPAKVTGATASQSTRPVSVVTPAEVAKNLSPLDRIIAELRLISPDAVGIEEKARELSRIIATSKRKDAFYIIDHLGPPVALDALGRDPVLEESLRTFAISTLGRVALDDDDSRAVSAIFMLGEWAKSGGKGRQKAIAALESLSKDRIIKASAPRMKALRSARAQIDE